MIKIAQTAVAIDTETTGLNPWTTETRRRQGLKADMPFAVATCNVRMATSFARGEINPFTRHVTWTKESLEPIREICEDPKCEVIFHNAAFDISMLRRVGIRVKARVHDTRIMAHICNPSLPSHGLKELGIRFLNIKTEDRDALMEDVKRQRIKAKHLGWRIATPETHGHQPMYADMWLADQKLLRRYCEMDTQRTMMLALLFAELLNENEREGGKLCEIYEMEMELRPVVRRMRCYGMTYLPKKVPALTKYYESERGKYQSQIQKESPGLNCRSYPQLKSVFIDKKGYATQQTTRKGNYRLDSEQLMIWARGSHYGTDEPLDGPDGDRLARAIVEWRASDKALDFLANWEWYRCLRKDGSSALHPDYHQVGPITGRMSCSDPALQQVPMAGSGRRHSYVQFRQREVFGPRPGCVWYLPDYSQVEVWIFAFQAKEPAMTNALLSGFDFHMATAERAWGNRRDFEEKRKEWRVRAKMLMFAKLYGAGIRKVAYLIRTSESEARQFVDDFDGRLPGVSRFMNRTINRIRREKKLINLFGREYPMEPNFAYKGVNYLIQGTAAELLKRSMIRIDRIHPQVRIMGVLHDEMFIELPKRLHSKTLMREIQSAAQEDSARCGVPVSLPVGFKVTETCWAEAKEVKL